MNEREIVIHRVGSGRDYEVTFENAAIDYRNFEGRAGRFNDEGAKSFALILPEDFVDEAFRDGWNVKRKRAPGDSDHGPRTGPPYVAVHVGFKIRPPRMVMITETTRKRNPLEEDTCFAIDYANVKFADVTVRPRQYDINGRKGIKIWLDTIYVMIRENYLDLKYADWDSPKELTSGPGTPTYDWDAEVIAEQDEDEPFAIEGRR